MRNCSKRITAAVAAAALAFAAMGVYPENQVNAIPDPAVKTSAPAGPEKKAEKNAEKELKNKEKETKNAAKKEEKVKPDAKPGNVKDEKPVKEDRNPDKHKPDKPSDKEKPDKGPGHKEEQPPLPDLPDEPVYPEEPVIPEDPETEHKKQAVLWMAEYGENDFITFDLDHELFSVTFKVSDDAADGVYDIGLRSDIPELVKPGEIKLIEGTSFRPGHIIVGSNDQTSDEADDEGVVIYGSDVYADAGEYATVCFSIKNNPGFVSYMQLIDYDSSVFEFCRADSLIPDEYTSFFDYSGNKEKEDADEDEDITDDVIYKTGNEVCGLLWTAPLVSREVTTEYGDTCTEYYYETFAEDMEIFSLTFKVKEDAENGVYEIGFVKNNRESFVLEDMTAAEDITFIPGTVAVGCYPEFDEAIPDGTVLHGYHLNAFPGEEVTVFFVMTRNPGIIAFSTFLKYDSDALEFISAEAYTPSENGASFCYTDKSGSGDLVQVY